MRPRGAGMGSVRMRFCWARVEYFTACRICNCHNPNARPRKPTTIRTSTRRIRRAGNLSLRSRISISARLGKSLHPVPKTVESMEEDDGRQTVDQCGHRHDPAPPGHRRAHQKAFKEVDQAAVELKAGEDHQQAHAGMI